MKVLQDRSIPYLYSGSDASNPLKSVPFDCCVTFITDVITSVAFDIVTSSHSFDVTGSGSAEGGNIMEPTVSHTLMARPPIVPIQADC